MKKFRDMKIGAKLIVSFAIMAVITAAVSIAGILFIGEVNTNGAYMYTYLTEPISYLTTISTNFQQVRVGCRDILNATSDEDIRTQENKIAGYREEFGKNVTLLEARLDSDKMKELYSGFTEARQSYIANLDTLIELAKQNKDEEGYALLSGEMATSGNSELTAINAMVNEMVADANQRNAKNAATSNSATVIMIVVMSVCVIIAVAFGIFLSRIISSPVNLMVRTAEKIADGDLDVEVDYESKDEIGLLAKSFRRMSEYLNEVMSNIRVSSEQVAVGSRQVSASSQALSQGATEQASSVEELTASIEQIASQTRQNAENAGRANELANASKEDAVVGNNHMKLMLDAMNDINESSANISKIIKVIDDIAFQTNILALNAAVEAARAGQHGKGFAVVAEEVRNLAARSANAAKETTSLIEGSIKKAEGGTKIASETAASLSKIVEGVSKAAELVDQIATASGEQSAGIAQINKAIQQVSEVIQTNSATSEEGASASEELSGQADMLKELVGKFNLKKHSSFSSRAEYEPEETPGGIRKLTGIDKAQASRKRAPELNISLGDEDFGKYAS